MSWNAFGVIEGKAGPLEGWSDTLTFSPQRDQLAEAPAKQVDFMLNVIGEAFAEGVLDGKYSASISGHDDPDREGDRKVLSMSLSPVT